LNAGEVRGTVVIVLATFFTGGSGLTAGSKEQDGCEAEKKHQTQAEKVGTLHGVVSF
jgi:hypothetical protein